MLCIVCFDVLAIIRFLKHDRYSREVIKPFKHSVVTLAIFIGFKIIYMAVLIAVDKSRYNDINTILYETDANLSGYRSNILIVHCFIHFRYHLELKWTLAGP